MSATRLVLKRRLTKRQDTPQSIQFIIILGLLIEDNRPDSLSRQHTKVNVFRGPKGLLPVRIFILRSSHPTHGRGIFRNRSCSTNVWEASNNSLISSFERSAMSRSECSPSDKLSTHS